MSIACKTTQLLDLEGPDPIDFAELPTAIPPQDSDLFIVERSDKFYQLPFSKLRETFDPTAAPKYVFNLKEDGGARGLGAASMAQDTAALLAATAALRDSGGGGLYIPGVDIEGGEHYRVNRTGFLPSNTIVYGDGSRSLIIPDKNPAEGGTFLGIADPANDHIGGAIIFVNENWAVTPSASPVITDENITFRDLSFGPLTGHNTAQFAILIRHARNVQTIRCNGYNMGEFIAYLGCDDTLIENCHARGIGEAPYNHWEGAKNARVIGCYAEGGFYAVLFNSSSTEGGVNVISEGLLVDRGDFRNQTVAAIYVAPLKAIGSTGLRDVRIYRTRCQGASARITMQGVTGTEIAHNTMVGVTGEVIVTTSDSDGPNPTIIGTDSSIHHNRFLDCAGADSYVSAYGAKASVQDNEALGTSTATFAVKADTASTVIGPNYGLLLGAADFALVAGVGANVTWPTTATIPIGSGTVTIPFIFQQSVISVGSAGVAFDSTANRRARAITRVKVTNTSGVTAPVYYSNAAASLWKWIGTKPTQLTAGQTVMLVLECFGTAETDVVARIEQ